MTILQFIILGLLQGLTEFLPVSSSGHLVLFGQIFGLEEKLFVSIVLHVATLLSVVIVLRKEIIYLIKNPFSKEMKNLIVSTIMTLIVVATIYGIVKESYTRNYLPFFFMMTAVLLILSDVFEKKLKDRHTISFNTGLIMGIMQGFAVFPGLSRSGSTISAGILSGGEKEKVAKHSFLMSVPIILASLFVEIVDLCQTNVAISIDVLGLVVSFLVAFIFGLFSLKIMIKNTSKIKFRYFSYYLIVLAIVTLIVL